MRGWGKGCLNENSEGRWMYAVWTVLWLLSMLLRDKVIRV